MGVNIAPLVKFQFNQNGIPAAGGKLYTYAAGTMNKLATYTDSTGNTPNTNPILLDANGQCDVYLTDQTKYKFILSPASDTDPPTNPYWTEDQISGINSFKANLAASSGATLIGFIQNFTHAVEQKVSDVLSDLLGFKSFGLVGDGVTGNSTAINAMLGDLGGATYELLVSRGDYLIDANVSIPTNIKLRFRAGARLIIPNGVTLTLNDSELLAGRQQIFSCTGTGKVSGSIRNDLIFPEWWGAIADGLHPPVGSDFSGRATAAARNAPALQAALTFAGNQYSVNGNTATVSLTDGYVYDTTLSIPLSTNLIGYGIGSALFYYAATGNAVEMVNTNNSLVSDIFIAPIAGPTWNFTSGIGLRVDNVSTAIVRNVWCSGFGAGGCFYFNSAIECRFYGLVTDNANGNAYVIRGIGQGSVLDSCLATNTDIGNDFDIQSGYDWRLIGCTSKSQRTTAVNGYYINGMENVTMTACGTHDSKHEGILMTSTSLNCTIDSCFVNGASVASAGTYAAMNISGTRNKLIAPKVTQNTPTYSYALILGGGGTDCTYAEENLISGTAGIILDAQPIGTNTTKVRKVTTTDATPTNIWAKSFNNNTGALLEAMVLAKQRGNAASAVYKFWVHATTGTVSTALVSGPTSIYSYESDPLLNATWVLTTATANAGVVSLQITGLAAGQPIDWEATVTALAVTG